MCIIFMWRVWFIYIISSLANFIKSSIPPLTVCNIDLTSQVVYLSKSAMPLLNSLGILHFQIVLDLSAQVFLLQTSSS